METWNLQQATRIPRRFAETIDRVILNISTEEEIESKITTSPFANRLCSNNAMDPRQRAKKVTEEVAEKDQKYIFADCHDPANIGCSLDIKGDFESIKQDISEGIFTESFEDPMVIREAADNLAYSKTSSGDFDFYSEESEHDEYQQKRKNDECDYLTAYKKSKGQFF